MLIMNNKFKFSHKDIGKKVLLSNSQVVKILTVIKEAGRICCVYGVAPGYTDVISWDAQGKSAENPQQNIIMLFNDEER